jgi:ATP-binding cassette subfamily D (ALD) protein 3
MPRFSVLTALAQKKEAAFRANHRRVITHSEEIALYGGGERECEILDNSFRDVKKVHDKTFFLRMGMGVLDQHIVTYGAAMVAYSLMMPTVYLGLHGLKDQSAPEIMKYYITSTNLFVALGAACKHLVLSYKRIQVPLPSSVPLPTPPLNRDNYVLSATSDMPRTCLGSRSA